MIVWRTPSALAPALMARRAWLCTAPSERIAAAAASIMMLKLMFQPWIRY